ncbi:MAG: cytochrome c [Symploca sp. SIO3E6]|nr:cytochrome c [Caldora sp. SIO3E6]
MVNLTKSYLDKQPIPPQIPAWQVVLVLIALLLAISAGIFCFRWIQISDPYIQNVLSLNGDSVQGHAIFQINCAGCHGLEANGKIGPSLHHVSRRKSEGRLIKQVVSGKTPPMPKFQPSPKEMADLLSYLEEL